MVWRLIFSNVHRLSTQASFDDAPINPLKCFWSDKGVRAASIGSRGRCACAIGAHNPAGAGGDGRCCWHSHAAAMDGVGAKGKVDALNDGCKIKFDDGDEEERVKLSRIKVDGKALARRRRFKRSGAKRRRRSRRYRLDVGTTTGDKRRQAPAEAPPPSPRKLMLRWRLRPGHPSCATVCVVGSPAACGPRLILGDTVVGDRHPLVIEYLRRTTLSLNKLSTALEALESVEPNHTY